MVEVRNSELGTRDELLNVIILQGKDAVILSGATSDPSTLLRAGAVESKDLCILADQ